MSLKDTEHDSKDMELETWPAFVDILSSTVVVLAFAFFIMVVIQSISRVTTSDSSKTENASGGARSPTQESAVLSDNESKFPKIAVVSPATMANNKTPLVKSTSDHQNHIRYVPKKAIISKKEVKVQEIGSSNKQVLGTIPKFTNSRVMEVLRELVITQQDVIEQQRKVIEQQQTDVRVATREYQSLLSLITENPEIEDLRQKITPRDQQAKFVEIDSKGNKLSGTSNSPKGRGIYVLSPPDIALKPLDISGNNQGGKAGLSVKFKDNAKFLNAKNLKLLKDKLKVNMVQYKLKGVSIEATPSAFALSSAEGRRVAVSRLLIIRSLLIDLGVNKSFITIRSVRKGTSKQRSYGLVNIQVGK